jgi:hypothetical protein
MSNHLAVATVTAVLRKTLQDALDSAEPQVTGARVTTTRPNAPQADLPNPGANIFLYQTTPSAALRGIDLPTRRGDTTVVQRPQAALDLHYLITFHGTDARLEPQVMLGIITRALHERPVLTRAAIEATLEDPVFDFLAGSDLADAIELARFSPIGLTVEEMSKMWSVFYQIPYVLSVAYRASVVLIESELPAHSAPLVRIPRVRLQTSLGPVVDRVISAPPGPDNAFILPGQDVILVGQGLLAPVTRVRFDTIEVIPDPAAITAGSIRVTVPAALAAGVHGVQVVHRRTAEPASFAESSNVVAFVLHPTIAAQPVDSHIDVTFTPPVGRTQHVSLLLNEVPTPAGRASRAYAFRAPVRPPTAPATSATLAIPFSDVLPGSYLVRVQVDGAESPLEFDPVVGTYNAPKLTIA